MAPSSARTRSRLFMALAALSALSTVPWLTHSVRAQGGRAPAANEHKPLVLDRAPARAISDPNPVLRAIAIDVDKGEVFVAKDRKSTRLNSSHT